MKHRNIILLIITFIIINIAVISCDSSEDNLNTSKGNQEQESPTKNEEYTIGTFFQDWGFSLFAIILSIYALKKVFKIEENIYEILELKEEIKNLNKKHTSIYSYKYDTIKESSISNYDYNNLLKKVSYLERNICEIQEFLNKKDIPYDSGILKKIDETVNIANHSEPSMTAEPLQKKIGYFSTAINGENNKGYFKKLLNSSEDSRFDVYKIGQKVEFTPNVSVKQLTSIDAMDLAIDFEGVSKNEANNMSIKSNGEIEVKDDKWIIVKKIVVTLKN